MPLAQPMEGGHGEREPRLTMWHTTVSIERTVATSLRSSHAPRGHRVRVAGSPAAAWQAVSLQTLRRPSTWRMSHGKGVSAPWAVAPSHPTTRPY